MASGTEVGGEPAPVELFEQFFGPTIFTPGTRVLLDHAEPVRALREATRVLDAGGRIVLNVCKHLVHRPVNEALLEAEARPPGPRPGQSGDAVHVG